MKSRDPHGSHGRWGKTYVWGWVELVMLYSANYVVWCGINIPLMMVVLMLMMMLMMVMMMMVMSLFDYIRWQIQQQTIPNAPDMGGIWWYKPANLDMFKRLWHWVCQKKCVSSARFPVKWRSSGYKSPTLDQTHVVFVLSCVCTHVQYNGKYMYVYIYIYISD